MITELSAGQKLQVSRLGGKGSNLVRLKNIGVSIPKGVVIHSTYFQSKLKKVIDIDKITQEVLLVSNGSLTEISKQIKQAVSKCELPEVRILQEFLGSVDRKSLAVRSSALMEDSKRYSWAGILESKLFVEPNEIEEAIKEVWLSLFSVRSLTYQNMNEIFCPSIAIIIQEMLFPDVAGVCFTCHPVSKAEDVIYLEVVRGIGDKAVKHQAKPQQYIISKKNLKIISSSTNGHEKLLTEAMIGHILDTASTIEKNYGLPMDIEWAVESNSLYITQARPVSA